MYKIITWSVVNNEISFIKDIIDHHLQWVDSMFFLDTGSNDGTLEYLTSFSQKDSRVFVEEYPIKYTPQYELMWHEMSEPFPEVIVRNHAISSVTNLNPDWIIQLDGDELFTSTTRNIIENNNEYACIGHSTINPVCKLEEHPIEQRGNCILYDPHVRIWKANQNIFYTENPNFINHQYHCIPVFDNSKTHLFHHPLIKFVDNPLHFHLHWMYGKKMENFHNKNGIFDKKLMIDNHNFNKYSDMLPNLFKNRQQQWLER